MRFHHHVFCCCCCCRWNECEFHFLRNEHVNCIWRISRIKYEWKWVQIEQNKLSCGFFDHILAFFYLFLWMSTKWIYGHDFIGLFWIELDDPFFFLYKFWKYSYKSNKKWNFEMCMIWFCKPQFTTKDSSWIFLLSNVMSNWEMSFVFSIQ